MYRIFKLAGSVVLALRFALAAEVYELEAKKLANLMSWKPGDAIAEIGAGEGQMSFWAVVLVGNGGHIYMTELDDGKTTIITAGSSGCSSTSSTRALRVRLNEANQSRRAFDSRSAASCGAHPCALAQKSAARSEMAAMSFRYRSVVFGGGANSLNENAISGV